MLRYFFKRLMFLIPVLFGVSILIFSIVHLAPGDPAEVMLGPAATQEDIANLREQLGLTKPLYVQYGIFLGNALKGDLGRSIKSNAPVMEEIMERFPATLTLALLGMTFAIVIGLPLGIIAALKQNTWVDALCSFLALVGFSIPNFWIALMLMLLLSIYIPILPSSGFDSWKNLIMPTIVLGIQTMAVIARMTRSSMLEVIRQDYVRTAKAKGISDRLVLTRHILSNVMIPVVTIAGLYFGHQLGG
ncbi:MAG TPA: ABC transporter permease, partial [Synergistales bacterium]|nr:ABC transporter permease [Synergistales bacterium]